MIEDEFSAVNVSVRIRPDGDSVTSTGNTVTITNPDDENQKTFSYDAVYNDISQENLYNEIGNKVVNGAFKGYNICLFAYGQTGCFAKGTKILMYDSIYNISTIDNMPTEPLHHNFYKNVEDLKSTDLLMGDDCMPRKILKFYKGREVMYKVETNIFHNDYVVNESHIMVFKVNKKIILNSDSLTWYNHSVRKLNTITNYDLEELMLVRNKFIDFINVDEIVEMSIKDYMLLADDIKQYYECYTVPLNNGINYRKELIEKYSSTAAKHTIKINSVNYNAIVIKKNIVDLQFLYRSCGYPCYIKNKSLIILQDSLAKERFSKFVPIITKLEEDDYYGFMIDSNHRFIGAGFNVLRNSGKTYSMLGNSDMGLIPRICNNLFKQHNKIIEYKMEISYMEIYSEKVNDLLQKDPSKSQDLKIKTHNDYGPYVDNLTKVLVSSYTDIINYINMGNKTRKVKTTLMNEYSSRSHAILTVYFTQIMLDFDDSKRKTPGSKMRRELQSKINLVDLAGSERIDRSGVVGLDMKDAININKSLTQLGLVISELSKRNFTTLKRKIPNTNINDEVYSSKAHNNFVSFRDSKLTWILKESLGGNSKTFMLANISASAKNYHETLSTLRYASNAKKIINKVKINEDQKDKIIAILKHEIQVLKEQLKNTSGVNTLNLKLNIEQREKLMFEENKTWEQKLEESNKIIEALRVEKDIEVKSIKLDYENNLNISKEENKSWEQKFNELVQNNNNERDNYINNYLQKIKSLEHERDDAIKENGYLIKDRDEAIFSKQEAIITLQEAIKKRDVLVIGRQEAIKERDALLKERDEAVINKQEAIASLQEAIKERDSAFIGKEEAVKEKDSAVIDKDSAIASLQEAIKDRDSAVIDKDNAVISKQEAIKERDEVIASLQDAIKERNILIRENVEAINSKQEAIASLQDAIKERDVLIKERDDAIKERDDAITSLHEAVSKEEVINNTNKHPNDVPDLVEKKINISEIIKRRRDSARLSNK